MKWLPPSKAYALRVVRAWRSKNRFGEILAKSKHYKKPFDFTEEGRASSPS